MPIDSLYSVRMRAESGGRHLSGAERIVACNAVDAAVDELIARAGAKSRAPERIIVTIDSLGLATPRRFAALDVITVHAADAETGRAAASRVLQRAGVADAAAAAAMRSLTNGAASSGGNMRGAMIMDSKTGERLEPDRERGVRVTRFDWTDGAREATERVLSEQGLTHVRIREALALATAVAHAPGVVAELCWSDDADYTAGYVASLKTGYVRFPFLKQAGDARGGRAIFVDRSVCDVSELLHHLQSEVVLVDAAGKCARAVDVESYFGRMS